MTIDHMTGVNLAYPPSPVWPPVLIAARKAAERVENTVHTPRR